MRILVAVALLTSAPPVSLQVHPKFALQRSDVRLTARVEPHQDNRMLRLIIDGPQYMAQDEQLEGEDAPKIRERWFKAVPPGNYEARAILVRVGDKHEVARDTFCIAGANHSCVE